MAVETFEASWRGPKAVTPEGRQRARKTVALRMREQGYSNREIIDTLEMLGIYREEDE